MNISRENIDALNAVVTIDIAKADYEPKYQAALKSHRKKVNMPGFRPGQVPMAMVQKLYGKALLAEEINRLVGETISKYIDENKIDVMGEPLPSESMEPIDFDKEVEDVQFKFDVALEPKVDFEVNDKLSLPYYTIEVSEAALQQQRESMLARFATNESRDAMNERAMAKGKLWQEDGLSKEGAVFSPASLTTDKAKKALLDAKVGDTIEIDINKDLSADSISYFLGISKEEAEAVTGKFSFAIEEITEMVSPSETTQEMRDQIFGEGQVTSDEEFTAKIRTSMEEMLTFEQDYLLFKDAQKTIGDKLKLELPEAFLKRWITLVNRDNKEATPEVIEKEFPRFIENMKWEIIRKQVVKDNDLKVEKDDLMAQAKRMTRMQFMQYGLGYLPDNMVEQYAQNMLKEKGQIENLAENAINQKVIDLIKDKAKLKTKKVSRDEFNKLATAANGNEE